MEGLIRIQNNIRVNLLKSQEHFKEYRETGITRCYVEVRLESLEETWTRFVRNHYDLLQMEKLSDDCEYMTKMVFDEVEEAYVQHKADLKESLSNMINVAATGELTERVSNKINLPQIQIPIFSGKYTEWPTFHNLFDLVIHQNSSLSNIEKLYYLKSHTAGEAELLLRHVPITAENYERRWNLIIKRYNNKRYIANNILNRLFGQNKLSCEDCNGIKQLLDTTNECLDALSNLNIDVSTWDILIVYIVMQRLDTESKRQWEQKISYDLERVPTLKELNIFLEARFRAIESLPSLERKSEVVKGQRTNVFAVTAVVCSYCQKGHTLDACPLFRQQGVDTRLDFIKKWRLCYNCLSSYHRAATCRRFNSCQRCRGRHHTLLHRDNQPATWRGLPSSGEIQMNNDFDEKNNQHGRLMPVAQAILPTALVKVESKNGDIPMKALLDQGSQASFITEKTVELLGLPKLPVEGVVTGVGGENLAIKNLVELKIQSTDNKFNCIVQAYVLNRLTPNLATLFHDIDWPELSSVRLADPCCLKPGKIQILLGADVYGQILTDGIIRDRSRMLTAQNTQLGWIISGVPVKAHYTREKVER